MKLLLYDPRYSYLERITVKQENYSIRSNIRMNNTSNTNTNTSTPAAANNGNISTHKTSSSSSSYDDLTFSSATADILSSPYNDSHSNIKISSSTHNHNSNSNNNSTNNSNSNSNSLSMSVSSAYSSSFLWSFCQNGDEITLLLDENDIDQFPVGALQISPQHWKVIKLSGRAIEFDETGIVTAMSQIEKGIPALNISTALTNCTLIPEELLCATLESLSNKLNLPIDTSEEYH